MSFSADRDISEGEILDLVTSIRSVAPAVSPVGGGILAALHLGITKDSRTFARLFGIPHAIVLREITDLSERQSLVTVVYRNSRTQRTELAFTGPGQELLLQSQLAP